MKNLKWCVISDRKTVSDLTIFNTMEEAVAAAVAEWNRLTPQEKKNAIIVAGTCNIDEEEQSYYCDDNGNIDADIYDIAWDSNVITARFPM
jgi:hypothetical protein